MARKVRFEYPGAMYHVLNRGSYRWWIFEDEGAKVSFERTLFETCESAGWILHAYAVMGNHFHLALAELGESDTREVRELRWEAALEKCLKELGRKASDSETGAKGEGWKVAIAGYLKTRLLCRNRWFAQRLGMGSESAASRYVTQMLAGDRPEARKLFGRLDSRIKGLLPKPAREPDFFSTGAL